MPLSAERGDLEEAVVTLASLAADIQSRLDEARYDIVYVERWPGRSPAASPDDGLRRDLLGVLLGKSLRET